MNSRAVSRPWSPHDDERLRKLADEGLTVAVIAKRLDRTISATEAKMRELNKKAAKAGK